jgi:hypothetical protein
MKTEKRKNNWKLDAKRADNYIHYCNTCKRCWEFRFIGQGSVRSDKMINHYPDFVSYGRKRKECISCRKNK